MIVIKVCCQGDLYGYQNMRSYLTYREKGKCQLCGKDFSKESSHLHHFVQKIYHSGSVIWDL